LSDKLCFLHNSLRRKHFAQARMVSSSKCALWTIFAQAGSFHPGEKVFSPKRVGEKTPGARVLFGVFSPRREILRSGEDIFTPRQEYFRLGENGQRSLCYFHSSERIFAQASGIFARASGIFARAKFVSLRLKKIKNLLFVSECLALLEYNVCI